MTTQISTSPTPLMWVSAIVIVAFSSAGIAAFMGWFPTSYGDLGNDPVAEVVVQDSSVESIQAQTPHTLNYRR